MGIVYCIGNYTVRKVYLMKNRTHSLAYYLKHEQECFIEHEATAESFTSDKARTACVLNGLKNYPSYEFIGEVILKINVV
jgi:hypothetical protein